MIKKKRTGEFWKRFIILELLTIVQNNKEKGIPPTNLISKCNLNYFDYCKFVNLLIEKKLITKKDVGNGKWSLLYISNKGIKFLEESTHLINQLNELEEVYLS